MSLESKIENQPFAVRRVVLASGWRQGLTSLFNMVILRSQNKITDFFMILAWASPFNLTISCLYLCVKIKFYHPINDTLLIVIQFTGWFICISVLLIVPLWRFCYNRT